MHVVKNDVTQYCKLVETQKQESALPKKVYIDLNKPTPPTNLHIDTPIVKANHVYMGGSDTLLFL